MNDHPNDICPFLTECVISAKIAWIETATLIPPKSSWLYSHDDEIELVVLTCRTHGRQFANVPFLRGEKMEADVAIHELVESSPSVCSLVADMALLAT